MPAAGSRKTPRRENPEWTRGIPSVTIIAMQTTGEISSLTGLRGVAALLVVVGHYAFWTSPGSLPAWLQPWTVSPAIGMPIFFTLSGYVIALNYASWNWRDRPVSSAMRFAGYRIARLYPAFLLFAAVILLQRPDLLHSHPGGVALHLALLQSWLPVKFAGSEVGSSWFHVSWSISTELGLYFMFAAAAIFLSPRGVSIVLAALLLALLVAWGWRREIAPTGWTDVEWAGWLFYHSPWSMVFAFAMGVAAWRTRIPRAIEAVASNAGAGIVAFSYLITVAGWSVERLVPAPPDEYPRLFARGMLVAAGTMLVLIGARSDSVVNRLLSRRSIVFVGTISYSLYLFHVFVPHLLRSGHHLLDFVLSLIAAIALAALIHRLVEVPGRRAIRVMIDGSVPVATVRR
jgi:peptidoglycan/LPS O-acetylase OafA/YrhL